MRFDICLTVAACCLCCRRLGLRVGVTFCATPALQALCGVTGLLAAVRALLVLTATRLCAVALWCAGGMLGRVLFVRRFTFFMVSRLPVFGRLGACVEGLYIIFFKHFLLFYCVLSSGFARFCCQKSQYGIEFYAMPIYLFFF